MKTSLANQLLAELSRWNTICSLAEQPDYRDWLTSRYPHWPFADDFSQLRVETVDECGMNMLWKDDMAYLRWFNPEEVMNTPDEFAIEGLLVVGASPCGDPLVIDTLGATQLEIGFVSHDELREEDAPPREALRPWPDTLLTFLQRIWTDPQYVTY